MQLQTIFFLLYLNAFLFSAVSAQQIPNKVWVYTPTLLDLTTLDILCLNNIKHFTAQSKWQFQLVTDQNYTKVISKPQELENVLTQSYLDIQIVRKDLLQLNILQEHGGLWIDLSTIIVQNFSWLNILKNYKYVNNRIFNPQTVLFYQNIWLQETQKRTSVKIQQLIVIPSYLTWFTAAPKDSEFIKDWKKIYSYFIAQGYGQVQNAMRQKGLTAAHYLADHTLFMKWSCRLTVQLKQMQLDQEFGTSQQPRHLAINYYRISGIQSSQSALFITKQSSSWTQLTAKYFSQVQASSFKHQFKYLLRIQQDVYNELTHLVDDRYPIILNPSTKIYCDDGNTLPYKYIVKDSILDTYLLKISSKQQYNTEVYDAAYVRQHCSANYLAIYYDFIVTYVLPLIAFVIYFYIVRKALLIYKPEWGKRVRI